MKPKENKLKNPLYTENLLHCASILCGCLSRVFIDNPELSKRLTTETAVVPAYNALKSSIDRITEDDAEEPDKNQLALEL